MLKLPRIMRCNTRRPMPVSHGSRVNRKDQDKDYGRSYYIIIHGIVDNQKVNLQTYNSGSDSRWELRLNINY